MKIESASSSDYSGDTSWSLFNGLIAELIPMFPL